MRIFFVALRKELIEQWRTYRLLIALAVLVAFGFLSPLTAKYTPEILKLIPEGEAMAKLFPAPSAPHAVAQEKDKGAAAMMLVKPLPRGAFLAAKFTALGVTFAASIALAAVACW